jgi:ribonuclease Z
LLTKNQRWLIKNSIPRARWQAQTAAEANVGQLVLTHLSPRYAPGNAVTPEDLLKEAQAIFPNTCLAKDFLTLEVKPRCNSL